MAFLEDYTLLDELGQGGYATVYKVRHNQLGYIRAIRVLNAIIAHGENDPTYQNFLQECRLLLRLGNGNHPNIVHIYQPLLKAQRAIVEMDYVDGQNLTNYLKKNSQFVPVEEVLHLLQDISSALAYCHEDIFKFCMDRDEDDLRSDPNDGQKILLDEPTRRRLINKYQVIHNDLHSANIIRRENGRYTLLDFGLAIEGDSVIRSSRRKNGAPEFKSPEKWDNDSVLTTQSDIYSFGVVLYEMLAGTVPFVFDKNHSNSIVAEYNLCQAHCNDQPLPIYEKRKESFERANPGVAYKKDYPDWLEQLILKCLEKKPEDRFSSGKELYECVQQQMAVQGALTPGDESVVGAENHDKDITLPPLPPVSKPKGKANLWKYLFWILFLFNVGFLGFLGIFSTKYDISLGGSDSIGECDLVLAQVKDDGKDTNVREGEGTYYDSVGILPAGTYVYVHKDDVFNRWCRVYRLDGEYYGYVSRIRFHYNP